MLRKCGKDANIAPIETFAPTKFEIISGFNFILKPLKSADTDFIIN